MAAGLALVINGILFFIINTTGKITNHFFTDASQPLPLSSVFISSIFPCLIGSIVYFLLEKLTTNGLKIFSGFALFYVQFSMLKPFLEEHDLSIYHFLISIMHLVDTLLLCYFIFSYEHNVKNE